MRRARPDWRSGCRSGRAACARAFISATNRVTEPRPTNAAIAFAASFALWISAAWISSRNVTRSPGRRLIVDSPTEAVREEIVATSSSDACSSATISRHQLRDRGHRQTLTLVLRRQHLAGAGVLDEVRLRVDRRRRGGRDDGKAQASSRESGERRPASRRRGLYLTRMRWPIVSATGSTSGLSTINCSTVVPYCSATTASVSPALIL